MGHVSWLLANRMKRQNPTRTKSVRYLGKKMKYHLIRLLNIYKHVWFEKKICLWTETFEQRKWEPLDIGRGIDQSDFSSVPSPYGYLNILDNLCVLCNVLRMIKKKKIKLLGQAICVEIKRWLLQKKKSHTLQTC